MQFKPETVTLYYNDAHIKSAITFMLIPSKIFKFANNSKRATFLNKTLLSLMNCYVVIEFDLPIAWVT